MIPGFLPDDILEANDGSVNKLIRFEGYINDLLRRDRGAVRRHNVDPAAHQKPWNLARKTKHCKQYRRCDGKHDGVYAVDQDVQGNPLKWVCAYVFACKRHEDVNICCDRNFRPLLHGGSVLPTEDRPLQRRLGCDDEQAFGYRPTRLGVFRTRSSSRRVRLRSFHRSRALAARRPCARPG
jgi:hypothetical protein